MQIAKLQGTEKAVVCGGCLLTFILLFKGCGLPTGRAGREVESPQRSEDLQRTARTAIAQWIESRIGPISGMPGVVTLSLSKGCSVGFLQVTGFDRLNLTFFLFMRPFVESAKRNRSVKMKQAVQNL